MIPFIKRIFTATKGYTILDFGILKICILCFGLLIGAYFAPFFLSHTFFLWVVFLITFVWILYRTFIKPLR